MDNLGLLFWISTILILSVRSESNTDYTKICEECNGQTLPDCTILGAHYNQTIYCEQSEDNPCTIGVVQATAEADEKDTYCLISHINGSTKLPEQDDGIKIISIVREPLSDMKPIPLALQMASSETTASQEATTVDASATITLKPFGDGEVALEHTTQTLSEAIEQEEGVEQAVAAALEENELETADMTAAQAPIESVDYQADAAAPISVVEVPADTVVEEAKLPETVEASDTIKVPETTKAPETTNEPEVVNVPQTELETNMVESTANEAANAIVPVVVNVNADPVMNSSSKAWKCFACVSTSDANCTNKPSTEVNCRALEGAKNGCYTLLKDKGVQRGCLSELSHADSTRCLADKNGNCLICDSPKCNDAAWPQCFSCRSSIAEPLCAWGLHTAAPADMTTICARYDDVCITYIAADDVGVAAVTVRACASMAAARPCTADTCESCSSSFCNGGVFPTSRRHCHQCAGGADCASEQMPTAALACPLYEPHDGCFLYANVTGQMQRGCMSSAPQFEHCKHSGSQRCKSCTQADACNSTPLLVAPNLSCSHCDSRRPDESTALACAWAQSTESVKACRSKYLYYLQESCQMIYQLDVAVRGCSMDMGACEPMAEWCRTCSTDACNTDNLQWQYCLQCSSEDTPSCATDAVGVELQKCGGIMQPYELRGCYTSQQADANITTRGCISDLTQEGMNYCKAHRKFCTLCNDEGCNRQALAGAAFLDCKPLLLILCLALAALFDRV